MSAAAEPLTAARVRAALRRLRFSVQVADDGSCAVEVPPLPGDSLKLRFVVQVESGNLAIRGVAGRAFPADDWPLLLAAINCWHEFHRWPRGVLHRVWEGDKPLGLLAAEHIQPCRAGIHDELMDETLRRVLGSATDFLTRLCNATSAPAPATLDASTLESWLGQEWPES